MRGAYPRTRINAKNYRTRDYATYPWYKLEIQDAGLESNDHHLMCAILGIGQTIFHRRDRVSASDHYTQDMLHTIYLRLFKRMMDLLEGFLEKHGRRQAFGDVWKALPPYSGLMVPKKAYCELTPWQGK